MALREPDIALTGRFERGEEQRYRHLPFVVPDGVHQLHISIAYGNRISSDPSVGGGNTLDIGLFDEQGIESGGPGFRGWSGSDRIAFTIDEAWATPPYRSGPIGAGIWHLLLGPYKIGPGGLDYRAEIYFSAGLPREEPDVVLTDIRERTPVPPAAEPGWVRGDLHCHSLYSDGDSWPSELLIRAAEIGLDFLAITDHNSAVFPSPPDIPGLPFLLPGIEVTTYNGHWNVWGVKEWFDFRDPSPAAVSAEMRRATAAGGFVSISHPRPWGPDWEYDDISANQAVEVWNGPWGMLNPVCVAFWEDQIATQERRIVAVGGSDTHELRGTGTGLMPPPKLGHPTTWIDVGDHLDTASLLAGLRTGRSFVSASPSGPQLYTRRVDGAVITRVVGAEGHRLEVYAGTDEIAAHTITTNDWSEPIPVSSAAPYTRVQVADDQNYVLAFANPI